VAPLKSRRISLRLVHLRVRRAEPREIFSLLGNCRGDEKPRRTPGSKPPAIEPPPSSPQHLLEGRLIRSDKRLSGRGGRERR